MDLTAYTWLLFDFDNTLVDFHSASVSSFANLAEEIGLTYTDALYHSYKLHNNKVWNMYEQGQIDSLTLRALRFEYFFAEHTIDFDPAIAHEHYIAGLVRYTQPDETVSSILAYLSTSHKLAIITNGLKEAQRPRLANSQLAQYFDHIVVSDEIGLAKPDAAYFHYTLEQIGEVCKADCLIIGDTLKSDILGGINSGIDTVWYNPQHLPTHSGVEPTYTISNLSQLLIPKVGR